MLCTFLKFFFAPEDMKKPPSKVAQNQIRIFFSTGPAAQKAQKQKSRTTKSPLMQDWVFRLGIILNRSMLIVWTLKYVYLLRLSKNKKGFTTSLS